MQKNKSPSIKNQKIFGHINPDAISKFDIAVDIQKKSYALFLDTYVGELFKEFFPIKDTNDRFSIEYISHTIEEPRVSPDVARHKGIDYTRLLKTQLRLVNNILGTKQSEEIIFAELPAITDQSTFIINGVEKVVVAQLVKATGIRFVQDQKTKGPINFGFEIRTVKGRGTWVNSEGDAQGRIFIRFNQGAKKIPITSLLRGLGKYSKEQVLALFDHDKDALLYIQKTLAADPSDTLEEVFVSLYKTLRSGESILPQRAKEFIEAKFSPSYYDISEVGRINFNKRIGITDKKRTERHLTPDDLVLIIKEIVRLSKTPNAEPDNTDSLALKRVRTVGELFHEHIRIGFLRMRKTTQDRMITVDPMLLKAPTSVINLRILKTTIQSFFNTNQLVQQLRQQNILDEIEHHRTVTTLGVGGVMRDHASSEVRDLHYTHYGKICPLNTPEGASTGLVVHFALTARLNQYGIIEAPYKKVLDGKITNSIEYLTADQEEECYIAPATAEINSDGTFIEKRVFARKGPDYERVSAQKIDYVDVSASQLFSIATSLIPFSSHNVPVRVQYGTNMQRQATTCLVTEPPLVATGFEGLAGNISKRLLYAEEEGIVEYVDAKKIKIKGKETKEYTLNVFSTNNSSTFSLHQRPVVSIGDKVQKGTLLADIASTVDGQLSLGNNIRVGFMSFKGYNFEDSILISQKLIDQDIFTSLEVTEEICDVRDTKLGPEMITSDIPNVSEYRLRNLDSEGIVLLGSQVHAGDVLCGKISPRGETILTPEERLLQSIFGEKAKDVKDSSLTLPAGRRGRVMSVEVRTREDGYVLDTGVIKQVRILIAEIRHIQTGDKLANRYGNKGIVSKILPAEDMPHTADGVPLDMVLSPLSVAGRLNLGQIFELHLGLAAHTLGYQAVVPPFSNLDTKDIAQELKKAGFSETGCVDIYDGQTGEKYDRPIAMGYMYIMKLHHMVEDKFQARSTGPYSLVSQQPLGGRSRRGGQRMGEMEVWALLGHGAAYTLREMLTYKSDDVLGRSKAYSAIIKKMPITQVHTPAAFNVLLYYLRGLGLNVGLIENREQIFETKKI
ncbi:MAG: DNA-directed RNA polymerase subunit beta [Alphaproteobacteria bacterium]|nr:DNA-directed RNA polymerase subunit beta [Alphaproteobacteria bacterium]